MFHDLRTRITASRRIVAWVFLAILVMAAAWVLHHHSQDPWIQMPAGLVIWSLAAYLGIRLLAFLLLDPLFRQRKAATGFARDLIVVLLYFCSAALILNRVAGVNVGALLGTGAIAAAVVGLSLQEVLGNLFAGISLHLDPAFQVGDWIEITGNLRGGPGARPWWPRWNPSPGERSNCARRTGIQTSCPIASWLRPS